MKDSQPLRSATWTAGALALAALILAPAWKVGFLADDFYALHQIHDVAEAHPGLGAQLWEGIARRWSASFESFRPLTMASLQIDYALHALDARGFRATNVALWLLGAWLFAAVCRSYLGLTSPRARAAALLVFALWPCGVEPLGWTVIRQDSFLVDAALLGLLALRRFRDRPLMVAGPLLLALASKETAIVLPFGYAAVDAALLRREGVALRRLAAVLGRRIWPWFAVVGCWWAVRSIVGHGSVWAGRSYSDLLFSSGTAARVASGLATAARSLVVPVNAEHGGETARTVLGALAAALGIAAAALAAVRARPADLVAALVWFLAPLALLLPMYAVSPALESVRIVLLPGLAWLFAIVAGGAWAARRAPRVVLAAAVVFLAVEALALRFNLGAYEEASARVDRFLADARAWPDGRAWLLRARHGSSLAPSLMIHEGAYVLSSSLHDALGPPFRPGSVDLVPLAVEDEGGLADLVGADPAGRATIAVLVPGPGGPSFRLIGEVAAGVPLELEPSHAATVSRQHSPVLVVRVPAESAQTADAVTAVVATLEGDRLTASRRLDPSRLQGSMVELAFTPQDFGIPAGTPPLTQFRGPAFIWSATLTRQGEIVARAAYAVVNIADDR